MPRCLPILTPFFDRFLIGSYFQLGPPEPEKSSPRCSESTIFQKIALRSWHRFLIDFGANMPPFFHQKSTNNLPKIDPKRHHFFDRFLDRFFMDFCSMLEANLAPCWPLFRRFGRARASKDPSKTLAKCYLDAIHFSIAFSMPSWVDLGSIFLPNLPPKIHQKPQKIDAKMPSHLESNF